MCRAPRSITNDPASECPFGIDVDDLHHCHNIVGDEGWNALVGRRLFLTGGTGFIGKWLLSSLLHADRRLSLNCSISVLTRNPERFRADWPQLRGRVSLIAGDVRTFVLPDQSFDFVVHAATDVATSATSEETFSTCVDGTRRVLQLMDGFANKRLLLVSSGAIYGPLPPGITHVPETYMGGPDPLLSSSAYAEGKRVSEWLACRTADKGAHVGIARVFALVGPHLPLDKHFAIGNFIGNALRGENIVIEGDGTAHRSYIYAADLTAWLWAVLLRGRSSVSYNIGGEESLSIESLANLVRDVVNPEVGIEIKMRGSTRTAPSYYVPDTYRVRSELHLPPLLSIRKAIARTAAWYRGRLAAANTTR